MECSIVINVGLVHSWNERDVRWRSYILRNYVVDESNRCYRTEFYCILTVCRIRPVARSPLRAYGYVL
jgi:hypothetical protein